MGSRTTHENMTLERFVALKGPHETRHAILINNMNIVIQVIYIMLKVEDILFL